MAKRKRLHGAARQIQTRSKSREETETRAKNEVQALEQEQEAEEEAQVVTQEQEQEGEESYMQLKTSDGKIYKLQENVAMQSGLFKMIMEDYKDQLSKACFPLPISSQLFDKVLEYSYFHHDVQRRLTQGPRLVDTPLASTNVKAQIAHWDDQFLSSLNELTLRDLFFASDHLQHEGLIQLTARGIANIMKDKSVDDIREMFGIKSDFDDGEEDQFRKEYEWVFKY